jgi:glycolate oxidase
VLIAPPEVRIPAKDAVERAISELERRLGPSKVDTTETAKTTYERDESEAIGRPPDAVVLAHGKEDVALALEIA